MWVNVRYFGVGGNLVAERGAYDATTATLTTADTKVYEMRLAISPATAAVFGKPAGPYHGIVPVDTVIKDNRIPPRGFTNANFGSIQIPPVGYSYADGQYWDDTLFDIPQDAARVEVRMERPALSWLCRGSAASWLRLNSRSTRRCARSSR